VQLERVEKEGVQVFGAEWVVGRLEADRGRGVLHVFRW
jgi:hypothetical protein